MTMKSVTILSTIKNIKNTANPWLDSLVNQDYKGSYNIVIIDSYSTDGTKEILSNYTLKYKNILIIGLNSTQPEALNYAIDNNLITGDLVALIDGDCIAPNNWLSSLVTILVEKNVDAVGGPGLTPKNANIMQKIIGHDLDTRFLCIPEGYVKRHPNMNMLIKSDVLKKIKFNNDLLVSYDADFGYRLNSEGYKLWYSPKAYVFHNHRSSLIGYIKQQYITGKYCYKLYSKEKSQLKGDNITTLTMTIQPFLYTFIILSLLLSIFNNNFISLCLILVLLLLVLFTIDVLKSYKIKKSFSVIALYALYILRLNAWLIGAMTAIFDTLSNYFSGTQRG